MRLITIVKVSVIVLAVILSACKTKDESSGQVVIADMKGNKIATIKEATILTVLFDNWAGREKVLVKMMPTFDVELTVIQDGQSSRWKYSRKGYIMSAEKRDNAIYRVMLPSINSLLKQK